MGINVSRQVELSENEYLKKFVGKDHIPPTDNEFWDTFLQYHIAPPTNRLKNYNYAETFRNFNKLL